MDKIILKMIADIIDDNVKVNYEYSQDIYVKNSEEISQKIIDTLREMGYDITMIKKEI